MSGRESIHGHYAGCAYREVVSYRTHGIGTMVKLECGHEHYHGGSLHLPTRRQCLEGPCYHPVREFAA